MVHMSFDHGTFGLAVAACVREQITFDRISASRLSKRGGNERFPAILLETKKKMVYRARSRMLSNQQDTNPHPSPKFRSAVEIAKPHVMVIRAGIAQFSEGSEREPTNFGAHHFLGRFFWLYGWYF